MSSRKQQKEAARARRLALEQQLHAAVARRRRVRRGGAAIAAVFALALAGVLFESGVSNGSRSSALTGPEGVPIASGPVLASPAAPVDGHSVDGISCLAGEQLLFHIHAHLSVFADGAARQIPAGIGIVNPQSTATPGGTFVSGGGCFYWLHTHAADGIIHIESPIRRIYTLGDFFDVWGQPLSSSRVGPLEGRLVAIYNGRPYSGNPRQISLTPHAQIQLEIGTPVVAPVSITFPAGL